MFSTQFEGCLNKAFYHAREKKHEFVTIEHLLFSLIDDPLLSDLLQRCGANIERLRAGLGIFIDETTPTIPHHCRIDIQPTSSFQRVLQRSIYQVQMSGGYEVDSNHVLLAIFGEPDSQSVYFLTQEGVTVHELMSRMGDTPTQSPPMTQEDLGFDVNRGSQSLDAQDNSSFSQSEADVSVDEGIVEQFTVNMNERARLGEVDPLIGRDEELQRVIQVLCRRSKNNPLLVGEAGVGKTAMAEGLAQFIVNGKVPDAIKGHTVYLLDLGVLVAGTKYRGDFEKRFKSVLSALSKERRAIIFIDEIHNLVGAGSATGGTMDAANLIKPLLSSGQIRCLGATTYDEYRQFFSKDNALLRRFQKVDVNEPTSEQTLKILQGLKIKYEQHHGVKYQDAALQHAIDLSVRYLTDRFLPDKAIDIIDEVGAKVHMNRAANSKEIITVDCAMVENIVASIARIPVKQVTCSEKKQLLSLQRRLQRQVFGQDSAIEALVDSIKLSRSGLHDDSRPIGAFLMAGPTGVGKTELSQQVAKQMGLQLLRYDMSEYMEKHAVSRLIGAPPGYVGFDQGGLLTEEINRNPHSVLLLDEVEKAHPDMFNLLLQVMDYGHLTDSNGKEVDFRHVIIMMTTNAGADLMEKRGIGFQTDGSDVQNGMQAISQIFSPEFRNRLDAVLPFCHLDRNTIDKVVNKYLLDLSKRLEVRNIEFDISKSAKDWLAVKGYDRAMGARPMQRVIKDYCKKPIAEQLLLRDNDEIKRVVIDVFNDRDELNVQID